MTSSTLIVQLALAIGLALLYAETSASPGQRPSPPMAPTNSSLRALPKVGHSVPCTTRNGNLPVSKNGLIDRRYRWQEFNVFIDSAYSDADRTRINNAMYELSQAVPCISFGIWPPNSRPTGDYIHIKNQDGCWSYVGKLGGMQEMSLQNPGCMHNGVIMHEMIHALGVDHEQCRADRDDYITVYRENIEPDMYYNFEKVDSRRSSDFGIPYNIRSIMHYSSDAFSKDGGRSPSMLTKSGDWIDDPLVLDQTDINKLRAMYQC